MGGLRRLDTIRAMDGPAGDCLDVLARRLSATRDSGGQRDGRGIAGATEVLTRNGEESTRIRAQGSPCLDRGGSPGCRRRWLRVVGSRTQVAGPVIEQLVGRSYSGQPPGDSDRGGEGSAGSRHQRRSFPVGLDAGARGGTTVETKTAGLAEPPVAGQGEI